MHAPPLHAERPRIPEAIPALSRAITLFGIPLALAACAVGPDFKKPEVRLNEGWSAKSDPRVEPEQTAADILWWRGFKDPALDRLIEIAHRQNLSLQIAGLRIVEARAQLGIATGNLFPQVQQVGGRVGALGIPQELANVFGPNGNRNFITYSVGFDAAWELDFWGKYRRGIESEAASMLASVADFYYALVSLNAEVARTYAVIREFEVLIEEARANVTVQEQGLELTQSRFRNGATTELDVTQATTLLESTRATVPELQTRLQQARNALSTLLGQTTGTVDALLVGPKEIPTAPAKVAMTVPAEMLRRRPDIRRAELDAAAQCARIGVAKAELYPSFTLFGTIGLGTIEGGNLSQNFLSTKSLYYFAGPQVNLPFFNYGRLENGVRVQDARFQQLLVAYHDTVLKAAQEVEDALTGFLNAQDGVVNDDNAVKAAQRSVEISMGAYRSGAVDYQRVLDAQRSLLEQQNTLTKTRSSVVTNLIALYKALGGGWEWSQGQPVVPEETQKEMKERTNWGGQLSQPSPSATTDKPPPAHR